MVFNYLKDSCSNMIGLACGWGGQITENLVCLDYLIVGKRFDLIIQLMDSKIPATQFLAAQTLEIANKKNKFKVDSLTQIKLARIKISTTTVYACYGCLSGYAYSIQTLFFSRTKPKISRETKKYIKKSFEGRSFKSSNF